MDNFLTIVITSPGYVSDESRKLTSLFEIGVDYIHIRKPDWNLREVRNLIEDIPYEYRNKLRLHGHFELLNDMNLAGVHLNKRNPVAPDVAKTITASCHSIDELEKSYNFEYVTLSPIFDSISKPGYKSKFNQENLDATLKGKKVIALGGIKPEHYKKLKEIGFYGAALLGYIWNNDFESCIKVLEQAINKTHIHKKNMH